MIEVIGIMLVGCIAGWCFKSMQKIMRAAEKICGWIIFLLLFSLGLSVGKNDAVMANISNLGILSAGISIAATIGSIVCAYFLYKYFFKKIKSD